jgi:hypothetical protein
VQLVLLAQLVLKVLPVLLALQVQLVQLVLQVLLVLLALPVQLAHKVQLVQWVQHSI